VSELEYDWVVADLLSLQLHEQVEGEEGAVGEEQVVLHLQVSHAVLGLDLLLVHLVEDGLQLVVQRVQRSDELLHQDAELGGVVGDDLVDLLRGESLRQVLEVLIQHSFLRFALSE
jgi:hypothetical protein